jgi:hypothetical protein
MVDICMFIKGAGIKLKMVPAHLAVKIAALQ